MTTSERGIQVSGIEVETKRASRLAKLMEEQLARLGKRHPKKYVAVTRTRRAQP